MRKLDDKVGQKEKIQILLAEYNSLRAEALSRGGTAYQILAIAAGALSWLLSQTPDIKFALICAVLSFALGFAAFVCILDVRNACSRTRELEAEINKRAGQKLLLWESERGGMLGRMLKLLNISHK